MSLEIRKHEPKKKTVAVKKRRIGKENSAEKKINSSLFLKHLETTSYFQVSRYKTPISALTILKIAINKSIKQLS